MSDYATSVKKVNAELLAFINRYEIIEDKDPITNALLKRLKKQINSLNTTSNQYILTLDKQMKSFDSIFSASLEAYKKKLDTINTHLATSLDIINNKYILKVNQLNEEINKLKKQNDIKVAQLQQDINFFIIASNQRGQIFEKEYNENIKRYDYQISSARDTYNQSIIDFNLLLQKKLISHDETYKSLLVTYDENSTQLIDRLNEKIEKNNEELSKVSERLNSVRISMKERFRQESITLNNEIRVLVEEKNKSIVNARTRYTKSQADSAIEKENRRQEYQTESQRILKEFVFNMTELDNFTNSLKAKHNQINEEEQRKTLYKLLELNKKQTADLQAVLYSGYKINNEYDKYTKRLIRIKNKLYFKITNQIKKAEYKKLKRYELIYQKELEKIRHNKSLLELDKNHALKNINDKEQSDNKHFQELNNIYENDVNFLIETSNLKYNQKANSVKCQSRIRSKGLEKDLDISEANFQKKIEMLHSSTNKLKCEIDAAIRLNSIVHEYEEEKYKHKINNLTVSTLLEIEKCKLLDQYNQRTYGYNVLNSKVNLLYSQKRLELENEQFEVLTNLDIEKTNASLQRDIINTAYKIKESQINELEEKSIQNRNTQYSIDSMNHMVLKDRFKAELKLIHQILSTYILLIREVEDFCSKFIITFLSSIMIRPEYLDIIYIFITDFSKIITSYYTNLTASLNDQESEIINKRIDFEEKFKFRIYYNDLLTNYEQERKRLLSKKKAVSDTIENYNNTVDSFRGKSFSLENQNSIIRKKILSTNNSLQKEDLRKEYEINKQKISDYKQKIYDIQNLKKILDKDDISLLEDLRILDKEYNNRVNEIKKMQYNSAISFFDLRRELSKFSSRVISKIDFLVIRKQNLNIKFFDFKNAVKIYKDKFSKFNSSAFKSFYNIVHRFNNKSLYSIQNDKQLLLIKFKNDILHIHNQRVSQIEENKKEYSKKVSTYLFELKELDNKINVKEKYYKEQFKEANLEYENEANQVLLDKKNSLSQFYSEFNAMSDNADDSTRIYLETSREIDNHFQKQKLDLTNEIIQRKNTLTQYLEDFIKGKEELINHLPLATKYQSQQFNKETRELNAEIQQETKNAKIKFNFERKNIHKNISNIAYTLQQDTIDNDAKHQKEISKEKKNHITQLRHLERNIKTFLNT